MDVEKGKNQLYTNSLNYEEETISKAGYCYIFFSSNGLYAENSYEEFEKTMLKDDRYEWKSIAKSIKKRRNVGKIIYVRDIYKKFYMYGINANCSTVEDVCTLLKQKTEGYSVITAGISSGGYMAVVAGCKLNAKRVFCISGQFSLEHRISADDLLLFRKINKNYTNVVELVANSKNVPVYYFVPINCEHDRTQYELVKNLENVRCFLFPDKVHAATVYPFNFPDLLYLSAVRLDKLALIYQGKMINKKVFLLRTMSLYGLLEFIKRACASGFRIWGMKESWDVKR